MLFKHYVHTASFAKRNFLLYLIRRYTFIINTFTLYKIDISTVAPLAYLVANLFYY